jgi:hypothetical protein
MKVLVGFEESQAVCKAFRAKGIEAYSNDLQDCSGFRPEWHLKMNFFEAVKLHSWNKIITFQPCTDLAASGAPHLRNKRESGTQERAIRLFFEVWKVSNCSENPMGIMNKGSYIKKWFPGLYKEMLIAGFPFAPSQIVQPFWFGDPYKKSTCLWLRELPLLKSTLLVDPEFVLYKSKKSKSGTSKYSKFGKLGKGKSKERSKTPDGLAKAMADQWCEWVQF